MKHMVVVQNKCIIQNHTFPELANTCVVRKLAFHDVILRDLRIHFNPNQYK